jgi:hypothetical protein
MLAFIAGSSIWPVVVGCVVVVAVLTVVISWIVRGVRS